MKHLFRIACVALFSFAVIASPAVANDKLDRLERDLQLLQKHVYRGEPAPAGATAGGTGAARVEVRFTEVNERLRNLEGRVETLEFENRQLRTKLERQQKDVEMRLGDIENDGSMVGEPKPLAGDDASTPPLPVPTETGVLKAPSEDEGSEFASSREHYDYAFRLLQQTQYDQARASFEQFIKRYPKDPLIGNAYYWAGQTYFVRQNYVQAADYFRQGFEALPDGPKAGDNLLKLARSLAAIDRKTEACVVLKQVSGKFGKNSVTLKKQSDQERSRLGCS